MQNLFKFINLPGNPNLLILHRPVFVRYKGRFFNTCIDLFSFAPPFLDNPDTAGYLGHGSHKTRQNDAPIGD